MNELKKKRQQKRGENGSSAKTRTQFKLKTCSNKHGSRIQALYVRLRLHLAKRQRSVRLLRGRVTEGGLLGSALRRKQKRLVLTLLLLGRLVRHALHDHSEQGEERNHAQVDVPLRVTTHGYANLHWRIHELLLEVRREGVDPVAQELTETKPNRTQSKGTQMS